jgi:hypothetical protein
MRFLMGVSAGVAVISGFALLFLAPLFLWLGPDRLLVGNSFEFNSLWIWFSMVVYLAAGSIGGWIAHRVAGSIGAVIGLIAVVVAFGLIDAGYHQLLAPAEAIARAQAGWFQLLINLREPLWYDLTLPLLMGIFIWVAGSSRDIEYRPTPRRA